MFVDIIKAADLGWLVTDNDQQTYQRLSKMSEPVMKIRWFASQNATHFRLFANQFNVLAHSGANHLVRGNVIIIRYKHPAVTAVRDCSWFHVCGSLATVGLLLRRVLAKVAI